MSCKYCPDIDICNGSCLEDCATKKETNIKEEIQIELAELESKSYHDLMASLMSFIYFSHLDDFQLIGKRKFAFAYAISRSYVEYGGFDFALIEKWVFQLLGIK